MSDNTTPTLRDLFAMAALQGDPHPGTSEPDSELDSRAVAYYRMADAMMRARARKGRVSAQPKPPQGPVELGDLAPEDQFRCEPGDETFYTVINHIGNFVLAYAHWYDPDPNLDGHPIRAFRSRDIVHPR